MHRSKFQCSTNGCMRRFVRRAPPLAHTDTLTVAMSADALNDVERRISSRDTGPKYLFETCFRPINLVLTVGGFSTHAT
eukprot:998932-Prymnesium_polylepis.2